jgi:hypothetical protein
VVLRILKSLTSMVRLFLDVVRKVAGIEIALECTDKQDELGTFDTLPHFRTTDLSDVNLVGEHKWRVFS